MYPTYAVFGTPLTICLMRRFIIVGLRSALAVFGVAWSASSSMMSIGHESRISGLAPPSHLLSARSRAPFFLTIARTRWLLAGLRHVDVRVRPEVVLVREPEPQIRMAFPELRVESVLGLLPKCVVDASEHEEEPIAGVGGLRYDRGEVRRLADSERYPSTKPRQS